MTANYPIGDALALKHIHHLETGNTLGWPGRTLWGTSPYERGLVGLWARDLGLDRVYTRRTRAYAVDDREFGIHWDTCLIVMIARLEDYREFLDLLAAIPPRCRRLPFVGKLSPEDGAALRGGNFRILRGSRAMALSSE